MSLAPAAAQITSAQIIHEAQAQRDATLRAPTGPATNFADLEELQQHQYKQRRSFEQALTRNRLKTSQWHQYAAFEVKNHDLARARSIFERCLAVMPHHVPTWVKYVKMELAHKNVNHARNLLDRAVTLLPREPKPWYLYVSTEEALGNVLGTRQVFQRWLEWNPPRDVWMRYLEFEIRYDEVKRARLGFERCAAAMPSDLEVWTRWANFEKGHGSKALAREVYALAVETVVANPPTPSILPSLLTQWAAYEVSSNDLAAARQVLAAALERFPLAADERAEVLQALTEHEKRFGLVATLETVTLQKRLLQYEAELAATPNDYDLWWIYLDACEAAALSAAVLERAFERAVAATPREQTKTAWRPYITIWQRYLIHTELSLLPARARELYHRLLAAIPHAVFSFGKVWVGLAKLEIRTMDLAAARKVLGQAIGRTHKPSVFARYIAVEIELREFDRVRRLYESWLCAAPELADVWLAYIEFERELEETERAAALFRLALGNVAPAALEGLADQHVAFLLEEDRVGEAEAACEARVSAAPTLATWLRYAEALRTVIEAAPESSEYVEKTRAVYERALVSLKASDESRSFVLKALAAFETDHGTPETQRAAAARLPTVVKRKVAGDAGAYREELVYVFPEDAAVETKPKWGAFLAKAKQWAQAQ